MDKKTLSRLQALDSKVLAQALHDLAQESDSASAVVNRLTRTAEESTKACRSAISGLMRSKRFIEWSGTRKLARKLENIVEDIAQPGVPADQQFDLICRFYATDNATFERCDDSNGEVGYVYSYAAGEVFKSVLEKLDDQELIAYALEDLLSRNDYGVRDCLLEHALPFLAEETQRQLVTRFDIRSDAEKSEYALKAWLRHIMSIASHLGDCKLYELTALESVADMDEPPVAIKLNIANVYFQNDDAVTAMQWMDKIDEGHHFKLAERNELLVAIHAKLGNTAERDRIARQQFDQAPSATSLDTLLGVIGEEHRAAVVDQHLEKILKDAGFSDTSLSFMLETSNLPLAADYVEEKRESIDGDFYWHLPAQAAQLEKAGHAAAAVCIYRALLDSILRRGKTPTYSHGVKYLLKLDELAASALPEGMQDHSNYKQQLLEQHGRKHSFWSKYDAKKVTPVVQ